MDEKENRRFHLKCFLGGVLTACLAMALLYFIVMLVPLNTTPGTPDSIQTFKKVKEIERLIEKNYLGEVDEQTQTDYMFLGLVAGLEDRYSTYYTKEAYEEIKRAQTGSYVGIGITIAQRSEDEKLQIVNCIEDSPADRSGVKVGDIIEKINGTDVTGMTSSQAVEMIQESKEDTIVMVLTREGSTSPITVSVAKETVEMVSVEGSMLENQTGYIQITEFTGVTASQFEKVYSQLEKQGMKKLIIDLRGNLGGLVDGVCNTLRQILPEGVIIYTEDKNGNREEKLCEGETPLEMPLAVLINEKTASAAEIFAGAVQDYEIGTLVGTVTFGKGIVQDAYQLSDGSVLKLTVSHYYTPKGNDIHGIGITPDVEVEQPEDSEVDVQLKKAMELLNS